MTRKNPKHSSHILEQLTEAPYTTLFSAWLGIIFLFGLLYYLLSIIEGEGLLPLTRLPAWERFWNSIYFSIITSTTVGYGDIVPQGISKILVSIQSIAAFTIFGIFVAKLVSHRQETALEEIYRHSIEDIFHNTREDLFIVRKDLDHVIEEVEETGGISRETWELLVTAYRQVQSIIQSIPEFYNQEHNLYSLDPKREQMLFESVERTLHRMNRLLNTLSQRGIDWTSHEESVRELRELVLMIRTIIPLWSASSPHQKEESFEDILSLNDTIHSHLERTISVAEES